MSLTTEQVRSAVTGFHDAASTWLHFRDSLYSETTVDLAIGPAKWEGERDAEPDSYGDYHDSEIDFVFSIAGQYFRKHGYYDSYDGSTYDGVLEEVKPISVPTTRWERK